MSLSTYQDGGQRVPEGELLQSSALQGLLEVIDFDTGTDLLHTTSDSLTYTELGTSSASYTSAAVPQTSQSLSNRYKTSSDSSRNPESEAGVFSTIGSISTHTSDFPESKLATLLKTYSDGKIIKRSFKFNNGFLTDSARKLLVRLIIQSEVDKALAKLSDDGTEKLQDFTISSETLSCYAHDIEEIFNTESRGTYFNPFKSVNGVRVLAHGKLWEHYAYVKTVLREQGVLEIRKCRTKPTEDSFLVTEEIKLHLEWLKTHCEPWEKLLDVWRMTYESRRKILTKQNKTVFEYFDDILALRLQTGPKLLECDFNVLWPDKHSLFVDNWKAIRPHLIFKLQSAKNIKIVEDKAYIHLLPTLSGDQQDSLIFSLLPYLIPSERIHAKKRKRGVNADGTGINKENVQAGSHKPSLHERRESFTLRVPTAADLNTALERRREDLRVRGQKLQPTPVIVGSATNIETSYVVIDHVIYNVESYLQAIDLTFKIFFSINCEYPEPSRTIWLFLQKGIYNIASPSEKFPVAVNALAGEVRHLISVPKTLP